MKLGEFDYNLETGELIHESKPMKLFIDKEGFYRTKVTGKLLRLHTLIFNLLETDLTGLVVVHLNRNNLDNSADNLEAMPRMQANKYYFDQRQLDKVKT
jgi:hypothetical protein